LAEEIIMRDVITAISVLAATPERESEVA